jgi:uncharacterized membrane protein YesL
MARKSFWNTHDHLGGCILLNLLWALFSLPWLMLAAWLVAFGWGRFLQGPGLLGLMVAAVGIQQLVHSPISAALWKVTAQWAHYRTATVRSFFPALRRYFSRSLGLWLCFTVSALLLSLNAHFYRNALRSVPFLGAFVAGLMVWAYLFLALVQIYALAFLVQEDLSVRNTLRRSLLAVLDNLRYTIVLSLSMTFVLLLGLISLAGLLFLAVSLLGIMANTGLREILKRYQKEPADSKPKTWAQVRQQQGRAEEEPRGWRDLWKPWETGER